MRLVTFSFAVLLLLLSGCAQQPVGHADIRWITLDDLADSFPTQPMAVGFDIDDTVLFSSPCFYYGQQKYSPGSDGYLRDQAFWTEINAGCDRYSLPKRVGRQLIDLHKSRGDTLYFITGRPYTEGEQLTAIIAETFDIADMRPVVFTSGPDKTSHIRELLVETYYGDADSDITSARQAGARPIRVIRASNSTYYPLPEHGRLGEEVLVDSTR